MNKRNDYYEVQCWEERKQIAQHIVSTVEKAVALSEKWCNGRVVDSGECVLYSVKAIGNNEEQGL